MIRKSARIIGWAIIAATIIYGGAISFLSSFHDGVWVDILGRRLYRAPLLVRYYMLLGNSRWAGFPWYVFDMVTYWSAMFIGYRLVMLGEPVEPVPDESPENDGEEWNEDEALPEPVYTPAELARFKEEHEAEYQAAMERMRLRAENLRATGRYNDPTP